MEKEIAIYWWSFNPPTLGHKHVIESVLNKTKIESIILNPDWERLDKDYNIEKKHRKLMIDLFHNDLNNSWLKVDVEEYFMNWKNWRDTTIMQVKDYYKEILWFEPWFIFWTDVINAMPKWKDNKDKYIEKKLKKIFIPRPWSKYNLDWFENYIVLDSNLVDISSSQVKEELIKNKNNVNELINKDIKEYINENNLYI